MHSLDSRCAHTPSVTRSRRTSHNSTVLNACQVKSVAASGVASFAVLMDGTVWAWGTSKRGQLGLGPGITQALRPQRVPGLEGISQVSAGWGHVCALRGEPLVTLNIN